MPRTRAALSSLPKSLPLLLKESHGHLAFSLAMAVAGSAELWLAPGIPPLLIVLITDGYLALLLWCCACMSAADPQEPWPGLPERRPAILVLLFALVALVTGFASLYLSTRNPAPASPLQAAYVSFMNIAGFGYDPEHDYGWRDKAVQAAQLSSGILLLLCALPILVSRFADNYRKSTLPVSSGPQLVPPMNKPSKPLRDWLKQPASWISLGAFIVSISTFFLVYAYQGELKVLLGDEVGVTSAGGRLRMVIPLVFTSTGAERVHRHVMRVAAVVKPLNGDEAQILSVPMRWEVEVQFISRKEFRRRYPDAAEPGSIDVIDYVNRAVPFHLAGGSSVLKTYQLDQNAPSPNLSKLRAFELVMTVWTEKEVLHTSATYLGPGELNSKYQWGVKRLGRQP